MLLRTMAAVGLSALAVTSAVTGAAAQSADKPAGPSRYSMAPADGGGFVRLDTQTGAMAICQRSGSDWACRDMKDDGRQLAQERDKLAAENKLLKDELKRLEDLVVANSARGPEQKGERFNLPSEEEVDKALTYVERMFKKFRDKMKELEGSRGATPL